MQVKGINRKLRKALFHQQLKNVCLNGITKNTRLYSIPSLHNAQLEYQLGTCVAITPGSKVDAKKSYMSASSAVVYFSLHNST